MVLLRNALHARGVPEKLIVYIASLASDEIHDVPKVLPISGPEVTLRRSPKI